MLMATEKTTLFNMGKKFGFLLIIIGKNRYRVNIGDNTWAFFDTYDPGPYIKTVIMAVSTTIAGAQRSQLESSNTRKLNNIMTSTKHAEQNIVKHMAESRYGNLHIRRRKHQQ